VSKVELFVIGASAGGLEPLRRIASGLPATFPAAICVVVHVAPDSPGLIPEILDGAGPLSAAHARDEERLAGSRIYVAPPDRHLLVEDGRVRLGYGPKENRFRPAVDPLFRSAALSFDGRAAGVILSGGLDDGVAGLVAIKRRGGCAIIQDPRDAIAPSMPNAALGALEPDHCLPAARIAETMVSLAQHFSPKSEGLVMSDDLETEVRYAAGGEAHMSNIARLGAPSMFSCPDCGGTLVEVRGSTPPRFRCHTGHAYTLQSLMEAAGEDAEEAIRGAVRSLEEYASLIERAAREGESEAGARDRVVAAAENARQRSALIQQALKKGPV
jgi:two-component system chemotaxis response regulator CheB